MMMAIFKSRRSGVDLRTKFPPGTMPMSNVAKALAERLIPSRKALMAWSSGRDEDFGGRFFCFHGLSQEEHDALKQLAESF